MTKNIFCLLYTSECLSWLIRNERIEFRIIVPKDGTGIAHSKCGVFFDGLNKVAFDGSCNFSRTALISNIESITAFCDWDGQGDACKIEDIALDFENTFEGKDDTVTYLDAEKVKTAITENFHSKDIKELLDVYKRQGQTYGRLLRRIENKGVCLIIWRS